jgi:O-Antigen ligase
MSQGDASPARLAAFDRLALVALFLQASELYRPIGLIVGVRSQVVNLMFIALYGLYLLHSGRRLARTRDSRSRGLLDTPLGQVWAAAFFLGFLMLAIQSITGILGFDRAAYWFGYRLVFAGMFMAAAVVFPKVGEQVVTRFFILMLAATWLGFVVNILNYEFIRRVLVYTRNELGQSSDLSRVVGFYQHPNMAAFTLTLTLAMLVSSRRFMASSLVLHAAVLAACVGGVIITGSRTSMLLIGVVVLWYVATIFKMSGRGGVAVSRAVIAPAVLLLTAVLAVGAITSVLGRGSELYTTMTSRLQTLPSIVRGDSTTDQSVMIRKQNLDAYIDRFKAKPLEGYGPDYPTQEIESGRVTDVSQNTWLEWAVEYGSVYPSAIALAFFVTWRTARRLRTADAWVWARVALLVGIFVLASFSIVDFLSLRAPVCILGALVGLTVAAREHPSEGVPCQPVQVHRNRRSVGSFDASII